MTHISAFEQDVEDAKILVAYAEAELEAAKRRLNEQKQEESVESEPEKVEVRLKGEPKKSLFKRKK